MKFRVTKISVYTNLLPSPRSERAKRKYLARRSKGFTTAVVPTHKTERERIRLSYLFEVASLEAPTDKDLRRKRKRPSKASFALKKVGKALTGLLCAIGGGVAFLLGKLVPRDRPRSVGMLFGAFCAALTLALLSALILGAYLLSGYFMPHEEFVIPDLVGTDLEQAYELYGDKVEFSLTYAYSSAHEKDTVISQYPAEGVLKKIFARDNGSTQMSLRISLGERTYRVEELSGKSERDALLSLQRNEISARVVKEYSDSVREGLIISTFPQSDSVILRGDTLTLYVSLGKRINKVSVPDLCNLTESGACITLTDRGLTVGTITYVASSAPAGRVIAQSPAPFESVEEGYSVDITVSAGEGFYSRLVPDLYGLTLAEAKQRLREAGLVIGSVYSVSSGAPSGTVVAQSPIPQSNIVSSITSVDVYISS